MGSLSHHPSYSSTSSFLHCQQLQVKLQLQLSAAHLIR